MNDSDDICPTCVNNRYWCDHNESDYIKYIWKLKQLIEDLK